MEDEGSGNPPPTAMPQTTFPPTDSPAKKKVRQFLLETLFYVFFYHINYGRICNNQKTS